MFSKNPFAVGGLADLVKLVGFCIHDQQSAKPAGRSRRHYRPAEEGVRGLGLEDKTLMTGILFPHTIEVTNLLPAGRGSLANAITEANQFGGATVEFARGLQGTITPQATLVLGPNVDVVGPRSNGSAANGIVISGAALGDQPVVAFAQPDYSHGQNRQPSYGSTAGLTNVSIENAQQAVNVGNGDAAILVGVNISNCQGGSSNLVQVESGSTLIMEADVESNNSAASFINAVDPKMIDLIDCTFQAGSFSSGSEVNLQLGSGGSEFFPRVILLDNTFSGNQAIGVIVQGSGSLISEDNNWSGNFNTCIKDVGVALVSSADTFSANGGLNPLVEVINASAVFSGDTFSNNKALIISASTQGADTLTLEDNMVDDNSAGYVNNSGLSFFEIGDTITGNSGNVQVFGIITSSAAPSFVEQGLTITNNSELIVFETQTAPNQTLTINKCTVSDNTAGALFNLNGAPGDTTNLSNDTFTGNGFGMIITAPGGGGLFDYVNITKDVWDDNHALDVLINSGYVTMTGCTFENQTVNAEVPPAGGSGVFWDEGEDFAFSLLTVTNTTFVNNDNPFGDGAIFESDGPSIITNVTMTNNSGGMLLRPLVNGEVDKITNCTISAVGSLSASDSIALQIVVADGGITPPTTVVTVSGTNLLGNADAVLSTGLGVLNLNEEGVTIVGAVSVHDAKDNIIS